MYTESEQEQLLEVALAAIRHGLNTGRRLTVEPGVYPPPLQLPRATFVTLKRGGALRGCIGTLEAVRPLVADVAHHAFAAAFQDPRFPPLAEAELEGLATQISILSPSEPMLFDSEQALLAQLRPGVDGLILLEGSRRGTFLPSVWEMLPEPREFLQQLKRKAGLPADYWSETLQVERYTAESVGNP